jgi:hypothetical protein
MGPILRVAGNWRLPEKGVVSHLAAFGILSFLVVKAAVVDNVFA